MYKINKIKTFKTRINNIFPPIYEFIRNTGAKTYLLGGGLRYMLFDFVEDVKDWDFFIEGDFTEALENFLIENNIAFTKNSFDGYKLNYNGSIIDIWCTRSVYNGVCYNVDRLFYCLNTEKVLDYGLKQVLSEGLLGVNTSLLHPDKMRVLSREKNLNLFIENLRNSVNKKERNYGEI